MKSVDELNSLQEKYQAKIKLREKKPHVLICGGTGCSASGSDKVEAAFRRELAARGLESKVGIVITGCHGFCEMGPLVVILPDEVAYIRVTEKDVPDIVGRHIEQGIIVRRLLYKDPVFWTTVSKYGDLAFYKKQQREVLANCGFIDPQSLEDYIGVGGYQALAKALTRMTPAEVIAEVKKSALRGRGGGGFLTGVKWEFASKADNDKKYVICNADEGDPGAFMDRSVLEGDPHRVMEGMIICGYAIGADEGYVYVRAEYPMAIKHLAIAIRQAEENGLLGDNIFGSGFNFRIKIKQGAGAFVCAEETALMASIEGKRGMPRPRPPFPAVSGLWGKPTNINNVETFANIPLIISKGADWYAAIGTENSKGTKIFALTGRINNSGLAEVPMGITLREIIYDIGGGIPDGKKFKAVQIGGPSGGCIPESHIDLPVDYDSLIEAGAMMGSGGLVVMDETTCMVDIAKYFLLFTQSESCGKCTPCREGTKRMLEIITKITEGEGEEKDLALLEILAKNIKSTSLCGLGQTAPNPVLSTLRYFRSEYEAHIRDKRCPAGACAKLSGYSITESCKGCGLCRKACPVEAIRGNRKEQHAINPEVCVKCGACVEKCPFKAIVKG